MSIKDRFTVKSIKPKETHDWLLHKHYAGRIPPIIWAFGLFDDMLQGVCTFGRPTSHTLCSGIAGEKHTGKVYELSRLVINDRCPKNSASFFISRCLKSLPKDLIIVSFADKSKGHVGKVYQATNWIYTGLSKKRKSWKYVNGENKHHRGITNGKTYDDLRADDRFEYVQNPRKHRYVYFTGKEYDLNYPIKEYPKGESKRYDASYQPQVQSELF